MNLASLIIGAVSLFIGYILGYWQGKIAQKSLDLSLYRAMPKIGVIVHIDKRQENPSAFPPFYYLVVTIHNEGELPAKQLKGNCKLHSSIKSVKERNIPIDRELLGSSPYELESVRLENGISGTTINIGGQEGENARFNVDIDFVYIGISINGPQHYNEQYTYDHQSRQMVKI